MNLFYTCPENNCHKKYKKKERMEKHLEKDHGIVGPVVGEPVDITKNPINGGSSEEIGSINRSNFREPKLDLFYLCPVLNCNRKFKKKDRLETHLLENHKIIDAEIGEPVAMTKENKKQVEQNHNNKKRREYLERKKIELQEKKKLELEAKKIAEEEFMKNKINEYKIMEEQKLEKIKLENEKMKIELEAQRIAEEEFMKNKIEEYKIINEQEVKKIQLERELEEKYLALMETIALRIGKNIDECSICADKPCDTAVIPCGHKFFCYECINTYHQTYAHRGCPFCRNDIMCVAKIFG